MRSWELYQEEAATYFRSLGLQASTDESVVGARTRHDVDVLVRFRRAGMDHLWVVECKQHARAISKDRVLALRMIVDDVGADRGILLAENGFQSGAREAATLSNVIVTSLADLRVASSDELQAVELSNLERRVAELQREVSGLMVHSGNSTSVPMLPRGTKFGSTVGLIGALSILEGGVKEARAADFPAACGLDESGATACKASSEDFVERANSELDSIAALVSLLAERASTRA